VGGGEMSRSILDIWKEVNESKDRPSHVRNAHVNLKWWLERHFPRKRFEYMSFADETMALERVISFIDGGAPVLMAVSHVRVPGPIVPPMGSENYLPFHSTPPLTLL